MTICKICFEGHFLFKQHLKKAHNLSLQEYYDLYLKENSNEGKCKLCGKETKFNGLNGYNIYCSLKCSNNDPDVKEKKKKAYLEKYGVNNPNKCKYVRDKIKQTNLEKYGTPYTFQSDLVKENIKKTMIERYGVDHPQKCKEIREKTETTSISRYGGVGLGSEKLKLKAKQTCIEKYGVTNPFSDETIKEQLKQECLEKYGVPYYCMTDKCRNSSVFENSSCNVSFMKLLEVANISYSREFSIGTKSYDFKVDNTLIEVNPTSTHNSTWGWRGHKNGIDREYHKNKSQLANENGYRCISLFDWDDYNKVINLLLKKKDTVYARKCIIKEVTNSDTIAFINKNHLQGYSKSKINIGLYYNSELVSIMTFGNPRYNKHYEYELIRYCYSKHVIGGEEKLFSYFIKNYKPNSIISYCDLSKFTGKLYEKLGFVCTSKDVKPSKHWVHYKNKQHITDNLLRQRGFDQLLGDKYGCFGKGTSNEELMLSHGFVEVYDCGQATYVWQPDKELEL